MYLLLFTTKSSLSNGKILWRVYWGINSVICAWWLCIFWNFELGCNWWTILSFIAILHFNVVRVHFSDSCHEVYPSDHHPSVTWIAWEWQMRAGSDLEALVEKVREQLSRRNPATLLQVFVTLYPRPTCLSQKCLLLLPWIWSTWTSPVHSVCFWGMYPRRSHHSWTATSLSQNLL